MGRQRHLRKLEETKRSDCLADSRMGSLGQGGFSWPQPSRAVCPGAACWLPCQECPLVCPILGGSPRGPARAPSIRGASGSRASPGPRPGPCTARGTWPVLAAQLSLVWAGGGPRPLGTALRVPAAANQGSRDSPALRDSSRHLQVPAGPPWDALCHQVGDPEASQASAASAVVGGGVVPGTGRCRPVSMGPDPLPREVSAAGGPARGLWAGREGRLAPVSGPCWGPGRTRTPLSWDGGVWRAATYRLASLGVLLRSPCPPCSPPPTKAGLPGPSAPRLALGDLSVLGFGAPLCRPRSGQGLNTPSTPRMDLGAHGGPFNVCHLPMAPQVTVPAGRHSARLLLPGGPAWGSCIIVGRWGHRSPPQRPPIRPGSRTAQDPEFWLGAGAGGCAWVLLAPGLGDSGTELRALRG